MVKTRAEILESLLSSAGFHWAKFDTERGEPINLNHYDPSIEKLFKALAFELEKLYVELDESKEEIIRGLAKVLIPDDLSLPEPGYTIAHINPKFNKVTITPEDVFVVTGTSDDGTKFEIYFSSLFHHELTNARLAYQLSPNFLWGIKNYTPQPINSLSFQPVNYEKIDHLWIGLEVDRIPADSQFCLSIGNQLFDEFSPAFVAFQQATWTLGEHELQVAKGLDAFKAKQTNGAKEHQPLTDSLEIVDNYEKKVFNRFKDAILTLSGFPDDAGSSKSTAPPGYQSFINPTKPLLWLKASFRMDIPTSFFQAHPIYVNAIPIVNRRLITRNVVKRDFNRLFLPLSTQDYFLGIHQIRDDIDSDYHYQETDYFSENNQAGTFMIRREGSVSRLSNKNASIQINQILELIYEEAGLFRERGVNRLNENFQIIDQAIGRVRQKLPNLLADRQANTDYYAVANMREGAYQLMYSFWETQGDWVKAFQDKYQLVITSTDVSIDGSFTLIPIQSGTGEIREEDFVKHLKTTVVSQNRIVTRGDIELFCKSQYEKQIRSVQIDNQIHPSKEDLFQLERIIVVTADLKYEMTAEEKEVLIATLQNDLNALSAFFTPIKVVIN